MTQAASETVTVRALQAADLDSVVLIDTAILGLPRRAYIERRLNAALREPALHAQLAAVDNRGLAGYILARVLEGEFGRSQAALRLEMMGVRPDARGHGLGEQLFVALMQWARRHGLRELRTSAYWRDTGMLKWIAAMGFELAPVQVLDRAMNSSAQRDARDETVTLPEGRGPGQEIDFGAREGNDFDRLARGAAELRSMTQTDLADITRIDCRITGRERGSYIAHRLAEAMGESGVRVSLTARMDGVIVGYLMARADLGDFGRTEPVAVIDTLGVDPEYARRGVGRALLWQLLANLNALRAERVESVVSYRDLDLARFFIGCGFAPAQRLAFVRRMAA